ncbi:hypothetical protein B0T18DRAFT_40265 [Schizothecium vesticola]|uniref:Uncharacterized protein n=1 Tax=Schizothecium vesticola TaxID=314040 RepID=A0AA40FB91_9PEZI|nr:hypothetical protein B0T18DRAFT_40265 [Schizothecium vesticola]
MLSLVMIVCCCCKPKMLVGGAGTRAALIAIATSLINGSQHERAGSRSADWEWHQTLMRSIPYLIERVQPCGDGKSQLTVARPNPRAVMRHKSDHAGRWASDEVCWVMMVCGHYAIVLARGGVKRAGLFGVECFDVSCFETCFCSVLGGGGGGGESFRQVRWRWLFLFLVIKRGCYLGCCLDPTEEKKGTLHTSNQLEIVQSTSTSFIQLQGGGTRRAWLDLSAREMLFICLTEGKIVGRWMRCIRMPRTANGDHIYVWLGDAKRFSEGLHTAGENDKR